MKNECEIIRTMIDYCEAIREDLAKCGDIEDFIDSKCIQRSCSFSLIQIGEFVKRLSNDFISEHREIEWSKIARFRDLIVHNYTKINEYGLWATLTKDVPILEEHLKNYTSEMKMRGE